MKSMRRLKNWVVLDKDRYKYVRFSQNFPIKQGRRFIRNRSMKQLYPLSVNCNIPPERIAIETTNICNTSCTFCPHENMKRKPQTMSMELYEKTINDCVELGIKKVTLSFFGEPLTDKLLVDKIKYAKEKGLYVEFFTNGMLLNASKTLSLLGSGLDRIFISLDATNPIRYRELRYNGDYNLVENNIKELLRLRNNKLKIAMGMLILREEDKEGIKEFQDNWKAVDEIHIRTAHGWATNPKKKLNLPCYSLWNSFAVLSNGKVVPCCMDYEGNLSLGDANKESLKDIWLNSKILKNLRHLHLKKISPTIPLCSKCDIIESLTDPWWYYD